MLNQHRTILGVCRVALLAVLVAGLALALPGTTNAASLNEFKKLTASDAGALGFFGFSVAISDDTAVVGAVGDLSAGGFTGAAYIFNRNQGDQDNWGEVTKLTASDAQANEFFGVSVAISGDTIVVGARPRDDVHSGPGAAYVFSRSQGGADNWGEVKKLTASDAQANDIFGHSVSVSGDTVVVGAYAEDDGGSRAGAAYVFQRSQGGADNWGEVTKITASDAEAGDEFGISVTISGNTAAVGAHREDAGGAWAGAAYVFQRDIGGGDNWGEVTKLTASDGEADDGFGISVAINGDTAMVGAHLEDAGGSNAGASYIFQRDLGGGDNWGEVTKLTASDAEAGDEFGISVTISGDTAVVGAWLDDAGSIDRGVSYVFRRDQGGPNLWGAVTNLTASDAQANDHFGISVTINGDTAVVGADGVGGAAAGAAYVFDLLLPKPTPTLTPTITPAVLPPPVGGIALDSDLRSLPLETNSAHSAHWSSALAIAAAANFVALGSFLWYTRRKRSIS